MTAEVTKLRQTVLAMLVERGFEGPIAPDASLFFSGKLDSLSATEIMIIIERDFGVDLSDPDFDITQLDTLAQIEAVASKGQAQNQPAPA
ncbi:MAG: acyl carrier protein [Hyphomicrobiales bacterium]|jgi:acyl carrier protein|nr:acyl carrier protein [Hyphomicrobiales bacterium]